MRILYLMLAVAISALGAGTSIRGNRTIEGHINFCEDVGTTDSYACDLGPALLSYQTGACYLFRANTINSGAATLNLNSLGAKTIVNQDGSTLASGAIKASSIYKVCYDGANMQLIGAPVGGSGGSSLSGPGSSVSQEISVYADTSGTLLGRAQGCTWSSAAGGQITCVGGFKGSDGASASTVILPELTANGSNEFRIVGAESMTADGCIVVSGQPGDNEILRATASTQSIGGRTCRVMAWESVAGTGDVLGPASSGQDEVAVYADTTGKTLGRGQGCTWSNADGGQLLCTGGVGSSDGSAASMIVLPELAANGSSEFRMVGSESMAADGCIVVSGQPGDNQILRATASTQLIDGKTCRVMAWEDAQIDCFSPTNACFVEEFISSSDSGHIGTNAWVPEVTGTYQLLSGSLTAPGAHRASTDATANALAGFGFVANRSTHPFAGVAGASFLLQARFRISSTLSIEGLVGLTDNPLPLDAANTQNLMVAWDRSVWANYQYFVGSARLDSGVALTDQYVRVGVTGDGGSVVTFSLYDAAGVLIPGSTKTFCSGASGCDANNVMFSTGPQGAFFEVQTEAAEIKSLDADYFSLKIEGITR